MAQSDGQDANANLTGVWQGLYSYAGAGEPVPFTATLIQSGGLVCGATHETCAALPFGPPETLCATVDGRRDGGAVRFLKTYDGTGGWTHSVAYEGAVNGEGTEIEGSWLHAGIAGRFLMTRPRGVAQSRKARRLAEV